MGNRKHFFKPSFLEQNGSRYYAWRDTGRDSIIVVPSRAFAQYQTLSLARRPACVVKGTPSYIVGQAWSLPSYRRVGVPAHARLRGRCSRRATTGSAFSSEFQRSQHEPSLFAAQSPLFQKPNHPALSAFRTLRFESPILRSHISPRELRIQRPKVRNSTQIRVVKLNRTNPHIMR